MGNLVSRFNVGDRIFSRSRNERIGTFAEMIAIDQSEIASIPPNIIYEEAASLPLVGLTSWQALLDVAHLAPRQKVLIHAGSSGIGTFAIRRNMWAPRCGPRLAVKMVSVLKSGELSLSIC